MIRELLRHPRCLLVQDLTGSAIQQFLPEHMPSTQERVPDLMGILDNGRPLHLEVMAYNDAQIGNRMYDVRGLFRNANPAMPPLLQIVVYIGQPPLNMPDTIEEDGLLLRYRVMDIRELRAEPFLASEAVGDVLMGVLCTGGNNRAYIKRTLQRIAAIEKESEQADALRRFLLLSTKRNLVRTVVEESENMPFTIDLTDDEYLREWVEQREEKARLKGHQEGHHEGHQQGEVHLLTRLLEARFGPLPPWAIAKLAIARLEDLDAWGVRLLDAPDIRSVLGD